ncbi:MULTISPECIES: class I SAM-dependent methyltransferase [Acidithrix]|uniref:Putative methyltransferase YcgJ n=1 Tax=Acidithrix ferrooxidans TaxID=1280514 RepID=A0A0D8HJW1_9ACTN|nr:MULTISPECIES: class I SAM-dependent methyltransferase [Acidithrix]KJF18245.1 putative methyltransferase YcgJ [Acidithrix ferrooxidans]CAG4923574.1 unnamed protein product [Acidithrix sp. C25]
MSFEENYLRDEFAPIAAELWSHNAAWWQEGFTEGADPEYVEQILPIIANWTGASQRVLEVGTGEGQILRSLSKLFERKLLVGIDPTPEQLVLAKERGGEIEYIRSDAASIPLADAHFDTVIACLVFEHIMDLSKALEEVARLLETGGQFIFLLNHPLFQTPDSGWVDDTTFGEQYWRIGKYLQVSQNVEEVEKDVFIPFVHRPLSHYINAAISSSLSLAQMLEPAPPQGFIDLAPEYYEARFVPRLLALRFIKS